MLFALTISWFCNTFKPITVERFIIHTRGLRALDIIKYLYFHANHDLVHCLTLVICNSCVVNVLVSASVMLFFERSSRIRMRQMVGSIYVQVKPKTIHLQHIWIRTNNCFYGIMIMYSSGAACRAMNCCCR